MISWARLDLAIVRYAPWPSGTWSLRDKVTGEIIDIATKEIQYGIRLYEDSPDLLLLTTSVGSGNRIVRLGNTFHPVVTQATLQTPEDGGVLPGGQAEGTPATFFNYLRVVHEDGLAEIYARGTLKVFG